MILSGSFLQPHRLPWPSGLMCTGLDCLAVIPARGASKRVPGKNIKNLLGKPAIAYTLEAAIESGLFARIVVSPDSESIAEIALLYSAEVQLFRATELADDHTPVSL